MSQIIEVTATDVTVSTENTETNSANITQQELNQHAQQLGLMATQLGYDGILTVGALEDGIRFYQHRTAESLFEMGKRLLLLKEMTAHGEFVQRVEMLGFSKRMAQKYMSAVIKISKTKTFSLLDKAGSQSKLLELLALDDDEIQVIEQGGSIGDVDLDSIEQMSVRELKQALRDAKADAQAKDNIIKKKDEKLNELDAELVKLQSPAQIQARAESEQQQLAQSALERIQQATLSLYKNVNVFSNEMQTIAESIEQHGLYSLQEQFENDVIAMFQQIANLSNSLGVQVDFENMVTPSWLNELQAMQAEPAQDNTED